MVDDFSREEKKVEEVKLSRRPGKTLEADQITLQNPKRPHNPNLPKNYYFDNDYVESLLTEYVKGGCTDKKLRDEIMANASELIRQIIRTHKLHTLTSGKEGTAFGDLYQLAWCVSPDTLVFTKTGLRKIEELCNDESIGEINEEIFGLNGPERAIRYIRKPAGEIYNISTKFGYNLSASGEHPFYVMSENGPIWKNAKDLKTGDLVAIQNNQNYFGDQDYCGYKSATCSGNTKVWDPPEYFTEELAYILGLIISEGSIEHYRVTIYNVDTEIQDNLRNNNLGLNFRINEQYGSAVVNNVCFVKFLDYLELGPGTYSHLKIIPPKLLRCSKSILRALLKGMLDGDGHSNKRNGQVGYTSTSYQLIKTLKVLLLNFGIVSRLSVSSRDKAYFDHSKSKRSRGKVRYESNTKTSYQLLLSTTDSNKFYDEIGFNIASKLEKRNYLPSAMVKLNRGVIDHFSKLYNYQGKPNHWYKINYGYDLRLLFKRKWCTLATAQKVLAYFNKSKEHSSYQYIADRIAEKTNEEPMISWLPIVKITKSVGETISLRVEPSHTFTANGFITHNCQIESSLYKFDYRPGHTKVFNMWCVSPDTLLMTDHGIDTIGNMLYVGTGIKDKVYGIDGFNSLTATLCRPETPTLKLRTRLGYELEATPEHRLYVLEDNGPEWVDVNSLKIGDLVGIQYGQNTFISDDNIDHISLKSKGSWSPPPTITEELAYVIGLFIAEGSWSHGKLVIYNIDQDVIDALTQNELGLNFIHEPQYQRISLCNKRFIEFMCILGFEDNSKANRKFIPPRLLRCSRKVIVNILKGMFDGDGHSSRYNGEIGYTSSSKFLINQLKLLLLNLGYLTKISYDNRTESTFDGVVKSRGYGYQLSLSTTESKKFYEEIGFNIKRKAEKIKYLKPAKTEMYGLIPHFKKLKDACGCGELGYNKIRPLLKNSSGVCFLENADSRLQNWAAWSEDPHYQFIVDRIKERTRPYNKIVWLPIISIEESSSPVCEITVDSKDHSYIANGFISHNSQVAKTVMLAYIKKESRDKRNYGAYKEHLDNKHRPANYKLERFIEEAKEICYFDDSHLKIIEALEFLVNNDNKPYDGLIDKLVKRSGLSRSKISTFLRTVRLRSYEFSDAPVNNKIFQSENKYRVVNTNYESEDE